MIISLTDDHCEAFVENPGQSVDDVEKNEVVDCVKSIEESSIVEGANNFKNIKVAATILKRGRPKGAKMTVIGLAKKKARKGVIPFIRLSPQGKNRTLLECSLPQYVSNQVMGCGKMIDVGDIFTNLTQIPDMVKDKNTVDIYRIQKYFNTNSWNFLLNLLAKKQDQPFSCYVCNAFIGEKDLVIHCQRCFNRLHLTCSPLQKIPKKCNYVCWLCHKVQ